ncbi:MAG: heme-copper oxidase subunit III [Bryobacterales bacterium]|nr:heme-copper oxidase subunit III [Bryobacterales bacterium]
MSTRVDAAALPDHAWNEPAPLWMGQFIMVAIESVGLLLLFAAYFYIRLQFTHWPPPGASSHSLVLPGINCLILLASIVPMHIGDKAVMRGDWRMTYIGGWISVAMGFVALIIQLYLMSDFEFRWYTHLYGSIVWLTMGMHTVHLAAANVETMILLSLAHGGYKDQRVKLGLNVDEVYWVFVVLIGVLTYGIVYLGPRIL